MKSTRKFDYYKLYAPLDNPDIVRQGIYPAKLIAVRRFSNVFGDRIEFSFQITESLFSNTVIMDSAADKPTVQGRLTDLLQGFGVGREALNNEHELVGRNCHIAVKHERNKAGITYAAITHTYP